MQPLFVENFLAPGLIKALCWTLIHSLWQGAILTLLTGLTITVSGKRSAAARYNIFTSLFFLFLVCTGCTFLYELNTAGSTAAALPPAADISAAYSAGTAPAVYSNTAGDSAAGFAAEFVQYFNRHAPLVVTIWLMIFSLRFIRMITDIGNVWRMRTHRVHQPGAEWTEKIAVLARSIGVSARVQLLQSELVKVPAVTGIFRPLILVPVGMLAGLDVRQTEAVLLHELAHIKRRDYFVNLLQRFAETVLFFNPAVHWVSSLIRDERENCCDDMAVSLTNDRTAFVNALVSFQQYSTGNAGFAMAFPGRKTQLLNRARRILLKENQALCAAEKLFLTGGFAVLAIAFSAAGHSQRPADSKSNGSIYDASQGNNKKQPFMNTSNLGDTTPFVYKNYADVKIKEGGSVRLLQADKKRTSLLFKREGIVYQVNLYEKQVEGLLINGRDVAKDQLPEHQQLIEKLIREFNALSEHTVPEKKPGAQQLMQQEEARKNAGGGQHTGISAAETVTAARRAGAVVNVKMPDAADGIKIEGSKITYSARGYDIVTDDAAPGKPAITAIYYNKKLIPAAEMAAHTAAAAAIIQEQKEKVMNNTMKDVKAMEMEAEARVMKKTGYN